MNQKSKRLDSGSFRAVTSLEEKKVLLTNKLSKTLKKKHSLELEINGEFEEIKAVEKEIEKTNALNLPRTQ